MLIYRRVSSFTIVALFAVLLMCFPQPGLALAQEPASLSASGGGEWTYRAAIKLTEPIGFKRVDEPVEITFATNEAQPQGKDFRVTDVELHEIPSQISIVCPGVYKVHFFAQAEASSTSTYYLYYGNPSALKPDYGRIKSVVDNQAKTWLTDSMFIKWGEPVVNTIYGTSYITTLKFDYNQDGDPTNDLDCITDDRAWEWFYGCMGSDYLALNYAQPQLIENGPMFATLALGEARLRSYKSKHWFLANSHVNMIDCFDRNYQFLKHGLGGEIFIPNWGPGDIRESLTGYSSTVINPKYLAFRNPNNELIFGAVAKDVPQWRIWAKYSGAWDRCISFSNNSNNPDAEIYWYADASNSYEGIEALSTQVLNPLQVEVDAETGLDSVAPDTTISTLPAVPDGQNGWYSTQPKAALSSSEPGTTYYQINKGEELVYSEPILISEGVNILSYYSVDLAGNIEPTKTIEFKVDGSKPAIQLNISPQNANNTYLIGEPVAFTWDATDMASGIETVTATLDDQTITSGAVLVFSKPGEHTLKVSAKDIAGNISTVTQTFTVKYSFRWLSPVKRTNDPLDSPYRVGPGSVLVRFTTRDNQDRFIADKSVKVVVSDGSNSAVFTYGKRTAEIKINSCDEQYILYFNTKSYSWLQPGRLHDLSVYFAGDSNHNPSILHGQVALELK